MMNERHPLSPDETASGKRRILVVDGSRLVRVTLAKRLDSGFSVIEEDNGESAWQRLMLDGDIVAVVTGATPPRLAATDLLARMRASALRRLRGTPMVLLVSDADNTLAKTEEWRLRGMAGLMTKTMDKEAMTACLSTLLSPEDNAADQITDPLPELLTETAPEAPFVEVADTLAPAVAKTPEKTAAIPSSASSHPFLNAKEFATALAALPHPMSSKEPLCVLVFAIDRLKVLTARFGKGVPDLLTGRIAKLLSEKIDPRDVLGRDDEDRVVIISHGVDLISGGNFGRRVCKSMTRGQIAIHGQKIKLTASVGVAATSDDKVASPEELLALAVERLLQATLCGGNTVCTDIHPNCPMANQQNAQVRALFRLLEGGTTLEQKQKETLGTAVLPLLKKIDAVLALGLPLKDVGRRLAKKADSSEAGNVGDESETGSREKS